MRVTRAINRRIVLSGLITYPVVGCTSIQSCESALDPRQRNECRNQVAFEKHIGTITIAAVLGAAAGYAIASSVRANPGGGALIGAFLAGGTAAYFSYANYLLEKANNDRLLAMDLVQDAISQDITWHRQTYVDINRDLDQSLAELKDMDRNSRAKQSSLTEQANRARSLVKKVKSIDLGSATYIEAAKIYPPVITVISDNRTDPPMTQKKAVAIEKAQTLLSEGVAQQNKTTSSVETLYKMGFFE